MIPLPEWHACPCGEQPDTAGPSVACWLLNGWRRGPELNQRLRLCRPLPSHLATAPSARDMPLHVVRSKVSGESCPIAEQVSTDGFRFFLGTEDEIGRWRPHRASRRRVAVFDVGPVLALLVGTDTPKK